MHESTKKKALDEYCRTVSLFDDWYAEGWRPEREQLEVEIGRRIRLEDHRNETLATRVAFEEALVEAIAEALSVGVPRWQIVEFRGWLSHNDVRDLVNRARKPYDSRPETAWPQHAALKAVREDIANLAAVDHPAAAGLEKSARAFLRRWAKEIPREPSEDALAYVAERWRREHVTKWKEARRRLLKDIDQLGQMGRQS